ncbi:MAG: histidinol-phosphatase [Neomegalonema sp.]|nr:histidinol-phosphatase [Neomegalonema sp.]
MTDAAPLSAPEAPRAFASDADAALIQRLADTARSAILPYFRKAGAAIANKDDRGGFDPVTEADKAAEAAIREILERERPEDGVLGEEFADRPSESGRVWVLDPIDGTRAFMCGLVNWGVLIALNVGGRAVLGALDQPYLRERFVGRLGEAPVATLTRDGESRALRTRPCAALEQATLFTTAPELFAPGAEAEGFGRVAASAQLVRYGTDCYGYAMVAAGCADLVVEAGLRPYDVQALAPLLEAAGGVMTCWDGGRPEQGGRIIAAGDPALHHAALELLNRS